MLIAFLDILLNIEFACKIIVWGAFEIRPDLFRPYKLVYFTVVVMKDEDETILHDTWKFFVYAKGFWEVYENC